MSSYLPKLQRALLILFHPSLTWKHNILIAYPVFELYPRSSQYASTYPWWRYPRTTNLPNCTSSFHPSKCFCNTPSNSLPSTTAFTMSARFMFHSTVILLSTNFAFEFTDWGGPKTFSPADTRACYSIGCTACCEKPLMSEFALSDHTVWILKWNAHIRSMWVTG